MGTKEGKIIKIKYSFNKNLITRVHMKNKKVKARKMKLTCEPKNQWNTPLIFTIGKNKYRSGIKS